MSAFLSSVPPPPPPRRRRRGSGGFAFFSSPLNLVALLLVILLFLLVVPQEAPFCGVLAKKDKHKKKKDKGGREKKDDEQVKKDEEEEKKRKEKEEEERQRLIRASLPKRKKKQFFDWKRLSPETTVLLSSTPAQVEALNEALPFHIANVTMEEHKIAPISSIDSALQGRLQANSTYGVKTLRTSVVFMNDQPLEVDNSRPARGAICKEGQRAMLVSFESVSRKADGHAYARLNLHSPSVTTFHREIAGEFQLKSLNPFMWSKHFPTEDEFMSFRGTAVCMKKGSKLQLLRGWPVTVPDYKEGPWKARVKVVRAFVTPSADVKKKNMYLLQATLHVTHQPKDGMFKDQNLDVIPFMGYIKLANRNFEHLEAAVIRHRLLDKVCALRRVEPKSQVELKCDEADAKLADLSEMLEERPVLTKTFKKIGLFAGISMCTYTIALANYLLTSIHKEIGLLDTEASLLGGTGFATMAFLYLVIAAPVVSYRRYKWRKEFGEKKTEYLGTVVEEENRLTSGSAPVVDLVFVVNELKHEEEQAQASEKDEEAKTPSTGNEREKKKSESLLPTTTSKQEEEIAASPIAVKIQEVIEHQEYHETVYPAYDGFASNIRQYLEAQEEDKKESRALLSFLKKASRVHPDIIDIDDISGKLKYSLRQLTGIYAYLSNQLKQEREKAIPLGPYTPAEILIWRQRTALLRRRLKALVPLIKAKGGDVIPVDESGSVESLKKKLKELERCQELLDNAITEAEEGSEQQKELIFLSEHVPKATEGVLEDLRLILDEDLGLLLEELDNLKSKYKEVQKAAGDEPSDLQEAEMSETHEKIKKLNEQISKLIIGMRRLGLEVDLNTVVAIERD